MKKKLLKILSNDEMLQRIDEKGLIEINDELTHRVRLIEERLRQENQRIERRQSDIFEVNQQIYTLGKQIESINE